MPKIRRRLYSPAALYALENAYVSVDGTIRVEPEHGADVLAELQQHGLMEPNRLLTKKGEDARWRAIWEPSSLPLAGRRRTAA